MKTEESTDNRWMKILQHPATITLGIASVVGTAVAFGPREETPAQIALKNHVSPLIAKPLGNPMQVSLETLSSLNREDEQKSLVGKYLSVKGDSTVSFCGSFDNGTNQSTYTYNLSGSDWSRGNINTGPGTGRIAIVSPKPLPDNCIGVQGVWKEDKGIRFIVPRELILKEVVVPFNN